MMAEAILIIRRLADALLAPPQRTKETLGRKAAGETLRCGCVGGKKKDVGK